MSKRQLRRKKKQTKKTQAPKPTAEPQVQSPKKKDRGNFLLNFYDRQYKLLMFVPFLILLLAFIQIGFQVATTGDFMNKGVSLEGGLTATIPLSQSDLTPSELEKQLLDIYPDTDMNVRRLSNPTEGAFATVVEANVVEDEQRKSFTNDLSEITGIAEEDMNIELMGPSLGQSFFRQTIKAMVFAFILMGAVVFMYFRTFVPSMAVIISAFSDIVVALAVVNMLGIKMSTAGIAGFLMLIGYSIDTDILLTTRVLREKAGDVFERTIGAAKTGLTMGFSTIIAAALAVVFSQSDVLTQIMTIVMIGLIIDLMNTWLQNVGLLRWYVERKGIQ